MSQTAAPSTGHPSQPRRVGILLHPARPEAVDAAVEFVRGIAGSGITCVGLGERVPELQHRLPDIPIERQPASRLGDVELMVVFGGDGTILRAAEFVVPLGVPLLGVNLGHVGFLAELESHDLHKLVQHVADRDYTVEERLTLRVEVSDRAGLPVWHSFAVNEVSLEKAAREKMLDVLVEIDGLPISRWGCDGMLVSTPTGSTAYAFSAGGPIVWPDVQAFLVVPMAAHALFARPMVLEPNSRVDLTLSSHVVAHAIVWCDGRRSIDLAPGAHITVYRGEHNLRVARLQEQPFTSRLVKKFELPIDGFRGPGQR
ncbi:NAD kinase [Brooklawnia cerclae]|uniref:NAD kinase n=1 Tax=Brooklawnia cerclae TaxID=349934 RepID=A0ABX0SDP1_9ACTN|nr:NAD+ kinase [Brooklawnia cerclae]